MPERHLLWMTSFSVCTYVLETKNLRDPIILLIGLILLLAWMCWDSEIWEKWNKNKP